MAVEYKWTMYTDSDGTITDIEQTCDSCESDVPVYQFETRNSSVPRYFCEICASTPAGNAHQYPEQFDDKDAMKVSAFGSNLILKQLGRFGERPSVSRET